MGSDSDSNEALPKSAAEHDGAARLESQEMEDFGVTAVDAQQMEHVILNRVRTVPSESARYSISELDCTD